MCINPLEVISHIKAKKLRPLVIMDKKPSSLLSSVPTANSLQLPKSSASVWWGLVGPKGMSPEVISKLNGALRFALADPTVVNRMAEMGATVTPSSAAEFGTFVKEETVKWSAVIKKGNIKAD
jgi:tripartite-type tricarboxylate transporter receptor subunit TctC